MGSLTGKKSTLERRLKELKKESELVRDDIKALSKAVKNPEDVSLPRLKSLKYEDRRVPPPTRKDPVLSSREQAVPEPKPEPKPEPRPAGIKGELFEWAPRAEQMEREAAGSPPKVFGQALPDSSAVPRNKAVMKDQRFANYFSSGNFLGGQRPMKQEKSVQRNKAVFMLVVVIIVAFSVFRLIFK